MKEVFLNHPDFKVIKLEFENEIRNFNVTKKKK